MKKNNKIFEIGVALVLMCLSMYMFWVAVTTDKPVAKGEVSAMAFPKVCYLVIIVLCAYVAVTGIIQLKKILAVSAEEKVPLVERKSVLTFLFIVIYATLWNVIGFRLSTLLFFFAESYMLDKKRPVWVTILLAVAVTAVMYIVFDVFFKVSFPEGLISHILGQ